MTIHLFGVLYVYPKDVNLLLITGLQRSIHFYATEEAKQMSFNELIRILETHGFVWINSGKSSKRIYRKGNRIVVVHYHSSKEIKTGTVNAILKAAGIKLK